MASDIRKDRMDRVLRWVLFQLWCAMTEDDQPCGMKYHAGGGWSWRSNRRCTLRLGHPLDCDSANARFAFNNMGGKGEKPPIAELTELAETINKHDVRFCVSSVENCEIELAVETLITTGNIEELM
jgi:hypothetical protein